MTDYSKAREAKTEVPENVQLTTIPARGHRSYIELEYPEFQSLCPISERHDQGIVKICYEPEDKILESKSLRDYLTLWRNKRNWQEYITDEIAETVFNACSPVWVTVEINWAPRGGIYARTEARRDRESS